MAPQVALNCLYLQQVMKVIIKLSYRISKVSTLCLKKPDTCDIFKYLQQIMTDMNNFWYRESSINLQSTDVKLPCEI